MRDKIIHALVTFAALGAYGVLSLSGHSDPTVDAALLSIAGYAGVTSVASKKVVQ